MYVIDILDVCESDFVLGLLSFRGHKMKRKIPYNKTSRPSFARFIIILFINKHVRTVDVKC